jgi:lysophospholipase L1-like esterase
MSGQRPRPGSTTDAPEPAGAGTPAASRTLPFDRVRGRPLRVVVLVLVALTVTVAAPALVGATPAGTVGDPEPARGPLVGGDRRIAILGDAFSSGEGAGAYDPATQTSGNRCHRSRHTYLSPVLGPGASYNLACSGALTLDVTAPDTTNAVDAQVDELANLQDRAGAVDAVVLTLGGNDAGLGDIAAACVAGYRTRVHAGGMATLVQPAACNELIGRQDAERYVTERLATLSPSLLTAYGAIDEVLNDAATVEARGRFAPIVVLAYPRLLPDTDRHRCRTAVGMNEHETAFVSRLVTALNEQVEAAANEARAAGLPVYFVGQTERAFLPGHTACDGDDAYVRDLASVRLTATDGQRRRALLDRVVGGRGELADRMQEVLHPNADGYRALTRALLHWSRTPEGVEAADPPRTFDDPPGARTWRSGARVLPAPDGAAPPVLRGGTVYPLTVPGFEPDSRVSLTIRSPVRGVGASTADRHGNVTALVRLPPEIRPGDHSIEVAGFDVHGQPHRTAVAFTVAEAGGLGWLLGLAGASALAVAQGLWHLARRRGTGE